MLRNDFSLQMSDDNPYVIPDMEPTLRKQIQECNLQVVNVTTPANYFHVLRRQVCRLQVFLIFLSSYTFVFLMNYCHLLRFIETSVNLSL